VTRAPTDDAKAIEVAVEQLAAADPLNCALGAAFLFDPDLHDSEYAEEVIEGLVEQLELLIRKKNRGRPRVEQQRKRAICAAVEAVCTLGYNPTRGRELKKPRESACSIVAKATRQLGWNNGAGLAEETILGIWGDRPED
jgi:hypothetical protein